MIKEFYLQNVKAADYDSAKVFCENLLLHFSENQVIWEGGSVSMFSPVLKFSLHEKFTENQLEVSESAEVKWEKNFWL